MGKLSSLLNQISFGPTTTPPNSQLRLSRCTLDPSTGAPSSIGTGGSDLLVEGVTGQFRASKVWNAVWNDLADFQLLNDRLVFGKCYYDTVEGARICTERCQMSSIGIASDTFGFGLGSGANPSREVPIAVAGWVLAYVDRGYPPGTPLVSAADGGLTAATREEKLEYPERIVGIYKKKELDAVWGPAGRIIEVLGRHWVKVK